MTSEARDLSARALEAWGPALDDLVRETAERARQDTLIDARQVADALECSLSQAYRVPGRLKIGRAVCWRLGDVEAIVAARWEADLAAVGVEAVN